MLITNRYNRNITPTDTSNVSLHCVYSTYFSTHVVFEIKVLIENELCVDRVSRKG